MNEDQPTLMPDKQDVPDPTQVENQAINVDYIGDPEKLLSELEVRRESYKGGRIVWDGIYYEAASFYSGRQYFEYNLTAGKLDYVKPQTNNSLRATVNRIVGKCRAVVSHMTSNLPTANVVPNSASDEDAYAARCGENWLKHSEFNNGTREVYREAARMNVVFGHSWIKTVWDKYGGKAYGEEVQKPVMKDCPECCKDESQEPPEEEAQETPDQEQQENYQCQTCQGSKQVHDIDEATGVPKMQTTNDVKNIKFEGEIVKKAISPFNVLYDPSVKDWDEAPDCFICEFQTIDYIKQTIPNCEDLTWEDSESQPESSWESMVNFVVDKQTGNGVHAMMVYEYYSKSTQDFPQGLHVIWVQDKIRVAEPMDTLEGERLPLSHSAYIKIPGLLRGMGLPEVLKATQTAYNKTLSQALENNQRMNNLNWFYPSSTKIINTITNESGQHIVWEGPSAPTVQASPPMSSLATTLLSTLDECFDSLSGVPKVAEGITDPSFNSGEQVEAATENSKAIHVPEIDAFVEMVADSCSLELQYIQKNMDKETLISFQGPDGGFIVEKFEGAMLRDNWNVRCLPGSALSQSRSAQVRELEMLGQIVMNGQADPDQKKIIIDKLVDFITHGEKDRFVSETNRHEMKIRRVIADIKNGVLKDGTKVFMPWHAPFGKVWMVEVENVLDSEDFDNNWDDQAKQILVQLWEAVTMKMQQLQMKAAQQVAGGPGGPPIEGPHPGAAKPQAKPPGASNNNGMPKQPQPGGTPGGQKLMAMNAQPEG